MGKLLLIDANNLFYRSIWSFLSNKNYNAVARYYLEELYRFRRKFPDFIPVFVWDGGSSRRKAITAAAINSGLIKEGYKEARKKRKELMPVEDMLVLMDSAKEALKMCWCHQMTVKGEEADDVIFSYCQNPAFEKVVIVSNDGDFHQCIEKGRVIIYNNSLGQFKNHATMGGMTKDQWLQASALLGDVGDSISGVTGWGEKSCYKFVKDYGSVENIKMMAEQKGVAERSRREAKLLEEWEIYKLSLELKRMFVLDNLPEIQYPVMKDEEKLKEFFFKIGQVTWMGREKVLTKG